MTKCNKKICEHCKKVYYYYSSVSGSPVDTTYNDAEYCDVCKKAIIEALARIPLVAERRCIDSADYTVEQLIDIYEKGSEKIGLRAVYPNLFDLGNPKNAHNVKLVTAPDPHNISITNTYVFSYWINKDSNLITGYSVTKQVWWDLIENKISTEH